MPSHNPYQYIPVDRPRIINWPKIILWGLGILILVFIIVFFIIKPLSQVSDRADDLLNQSDNRPQEIIDKFAPDSVPGCGEDFYNCDDFQTQVGAQWVYDYCQNDGAGDVHQLDNDGDGMVCE